ncbi:DUF5133 domain-containing protein [Streptomyces sp. A012304]|uniref:DUF5133 domain-containing protein n=1 Tax=Streptomyces sp. A012304 TaxID=375446 RepID=UPI0022324977|nr:DUF5133 domain-containing protein [Streptomyces sp. A012304]GKQ35619.1 DUF5133 domain-containing protein [Streptomyces sp. A012304]
MLMPHPAVLRTLVDEYEAVTSTGSVAESARAQDLAYTLCVSTGTREVTLALETARRWLAAASAADAGTGGAARPRSGEGPHVYA